MLSALMIMVMSFLCITSVSADTQSDIRDTRAAQDAAQERLDQANSQIAAMEGEKSSLETYLADLNSQLTALSDSLSTLATQIEEKNVEIEMTKAAHERAALAVENQYQDMQTRIQYMYENGTGLLQTLFSADNLTDFLNRADEIQQIQAYDRSCLADYKETCRDEEAKQASLEAEEAEMEGLKAQQEAARAQVQELATQTDAKIAEYAALIDDQNSVAADLRNQIAAQQQRIQELEAQAAAEEEARRKAAEEEARLAAVAAQKAAEEEAAKAAAAASQEATSKTSEPVAESVANVETAPSGSGTYLGNFTLTAYCACSKCCGKYANGRTASGTTATEGRTVAMGGVPFGTKLLINGVVYTVEDRGTGYGHVDIFMNSHSACLQFGLRHADVYQVG